MLNEKSRSKQANPFKPENNIEIFTHYKQWIAIESHTSVSEMSV